MQMIDVASKAMQTVATPSERKPSFIIASRLMEIGLGSAWSHQPGHEAAPGDAKTWKQCRSIMTACGLSQTQSQDVMRTLPWAWSSLAECLPSLDAIADHDPAQANAMLHAIIVADCNLRASENQVRSCEVFQRTVF
jgi:hypothetical protein